MKSADQNGTAVLFGMILGHERTYKIKLVPIIIILCADARRLCARANRKHQIFQLDAKYSKMNGYKI